MESSLPYQFFQAMLLIRTITKNISCEFSRGTDSNRTHVILRCDNVRRGFTLTIEVGNLFCFFSFTFKGLVVFCCVI